MSFPLVTLRHIGAADTLVVNARDLHAFLEVGRDFSNWIKDRIQQHGLTDGAGYVSYSRSPDLVSGNRGARIEYDLTTTAAKHIAMAERNERGKQVRDYFLECERKALAEAIACFDVPKTYGAALQLAANQQVQIEAQHQVIAVLAPKAKALELIADTEGLVLISDAAKTLSMEIKDLFAWMMANRWIFRRRGSKRYRAFADKLAAGYLKNKYHSVPQQDGSVAQKEQVHLTPKGIAHLAVIFGREASR